MNKTVGIILILFQFLPQLGRTQLNITKICDSVYVFTTYQTYKESQVSSHGLLVQTPLGVVVVDTPWDSTQFQPLLDTIQLRFHQPVLRVISTHWHDDRTAGLAYYASKGIQTYSSLATRNLCLENKNPFAQYTFENDTLFHDGNRTIEVYYPGAGHSSDNVVVYLPKERVLYGGCFIKSSDAKDLGNVKDANLGMWPVALNNLKNHFKHVKLIIPGHFSLSNNKHKYLIRHTKKLIHYHFKGKTLK
jgi:metallo-beta-lactamase class B